MKVSERSFWKDIIEGAAEAYRCTTIWHKSYILKHIWNEHLNKVSKYFNMYTYIHISFIFIQPQLLKQSVEFTFPFLKKSRDVLFHIEMLEFTKSFSLWRFANTTNKGHISKRSILWEICTAYTSVGIQRSQYTQKG